MFVRRLFAAIIAIMIASALFALAACSQQSNSDSRWPDTDVIDVKDSSIVSTSDIVEPKLTVINLWALWCAPCREELPRLQNISVEFADDLQVVGINIGDDFDKTIAYISEAGLTFPMYWDETGDLLTALKVPSVPATLAIDEKGNIVWSHLGALSAAELNKKISSLADS
jgi:thiol-disulfide isomerase/thioredoxin